MNRCLPLHLPLIRCLCSVRLPVIRILVLLGLGASAQSSCAAAPSDSEDITELSLEELHAISISAASKRSEPLFETPAAVSVLLPVDIDRVGMASVPEALRLIP